MKAYLNIVLPPILPIGIFPTMDLRTSSFAIMFLSKSVSIAVGCTELTRI